MAGLDDHGKDLSNLVLFVRLEVTEQEGVKLKQYQLVTADQTGYQSHH